MARELAEAHVLQQAAQTFGDRARQYDQATSRSSCHTPTCRVQVECSGCHGDFDVWEANLFDHNQGTRFPLDGRHADVPCADCHEELTLPDGHTLTRYKPIGYECQDCHDFIPEGGEPTPAK